MTIRAGSQTQVGVTLPTLPPCTVVLEKEWMVIESPYTHPPCFYGDPTYQDHLHDDSPQMPETLDPQRLREYHQVWGLPPETHLPRVINLKPPGQTKARP